MHGSQSQQGSTSSPNQQTLQARTLTARILHLALTVAMVIYGVVLHVILAVQKEAPPMTSQEATPILVALAVVALGTAAIAIPIVRRKLLPPSKPPQHREDYFSAPRIPPAVGAALSKYLTASIVTWALIESLALYGLVAGFILMDAWPYYAFGGPALALMVFFVPRRIDLEAVARAALDAPSSN